MPHASDASTVGAVGVTIAQHAVESDLGWVFRRIEHRDTGLDAEVEAVVRSRATGLLLGLQIKSGASYFRERTHAGWKYRGDLDHLEYWRGHTLGVVIVLVDTDSRTAYWASVGEDAVVEEADKSWTVEVPRAQVVSAACWQPWMNLAWASSDRNALFRYCGLFAEYMRHLGTGGQLFVAVQDWANKTRGQVHFEVVLVSADGDEHTEEFGFFAGVNDAADFLATVFPWAALDVDDDFYEEHEDVEPDAVFQDSDEPGGYIVIERERPVGIRPYADAGGGEILLYRFELSLNELGRGFLAVDAAAKAMEGRPPQTVGLAIRQMTQSSRQGRTQEPKTS